MSDFKVEQVINSSTIKVSPKWQMNFNGHTYSGDKINIRGLEDLKGLNVQQSVTNRLQKILINTTQELVFDSPELIHYENEKDATVSCSLYIGHDNIVYYFPEFVQKY